MVLTLNVIFLAQSPALLNFFLLLNLPPDARGSKTPCAWQPTEAQ
jgi:hypothetical protein